MTAQDGFESLSLIADFKPDVIFLDIMMPRLDGYQTCAIIKSNPKFSSIPVIMLSSKNNLFDKARGRLAGSEEYITKPFTEDDLRSALIPYTNASIGGLSDDALSLDKEVAPETEKPQARIKLTKTSVFDDLDFTAESTDPLLDLNFDTPAADTSKVTTDALLDLNFDTPEASKSAATKPTISLLDIDLTK